MHVKSKQYCEINYALYAAIFSSKICSFFLTYSSIFLWFSLSLFTSSYSYD